MNLLKKKNKKKRLSQEDHYIWGSVASESLKNAYSVFIHMLKYLVFVCFSPVFMQGISVVQLDAPVVLPTQEPSSALRITTMTSAAANALRWPLEVLQLVCHLYVISNFV